jgi:hypothetical protein
MRNAGGKLTFYVLYQAFSVLKHFAVPHPSFCIAIYMAMQKSTFPPGEGIAPSALNSSIN